VPPLPIDQQTTFLSYFRLIYSTNLNFFGDSALTRNEGPSSSISISAIEGRIHQIRSQRVVLDKDLAELFGVTTYRLNEQIKRNRQRFPHDFMFQSTDQEVSALRSQTAISKKGRGGRRYLPYAFTEHGVVMAANVLNSPIAVESSVLIVRAFIRLREMLREHSDLKQRLEKLEVRLARGFAEHEQELQEIRFLIAQLEQPIDVKKRKIGF